MSDYRTEKQRMVANEAASMSGRATYELSRMDKNGLTPEQLAAVQAFQDAMRAAQKQLRKAFDIEG